MELLVVYSILEYGEIGKLLTIYANIHIFALSTTTNLEVAAMKKISLTRVF